MGDYRSIEGRDTSLSRYLFSWVIFLFVYIRREKKKVIDGVIDMYTYIYRVCEVKEEKKTVRNRQIDLFTRTKHLTNSMIKCQATIRVF